MRVLLRNKNTRLYRGSEKGWVSAPEQALGFTNVPEATRFAFQEPVHGAEIVLRFEAVSDEVVVPVVPEYRNITPRHHSFGA